MHPKKKKKQKQKQKHMSYSTSNLALKQNVSQETDKVAKIQEKILQPHDKKPPKEQKLRLMIYQSQSIKKNLQLKLDAA